jgi:hypothetical protein
MSLRRIVKDATGLNLNECRLCLDCDVFLSEEQDVPLGTLVQMVVMDDEEALQTRTLWSDPVLEASGRACKRGLDLRAMMLALRDEARRRNLA